MIERFRPSIRAACETVAELIALALFVALIALVAMVLS